MTAQAGTSPLTIGRLAKHAGVNVETIRYYQRIGLVKEPSKPRQGFRQYSQATLEQVKFIKRAQQLGFSLQEIKELLELGAGNCRDIRIHAEDKRNRIKQQIRDLQNLEKTLGKLISSCQSGKGQQPCPIVETLLSE